MLSYFNYFRNHKGCCMTKGKIHLTCEKNKHKRLLTLLDIFCPKHIKRG